MKGIGRMDVTMTVTATTDTDATTYKVRQSGLPKLRMCDGPQTSMWMDFFSGCLGLLCCSPLAYLLAGRLGMAYSQESQIKGGTIDSMIASFGYRAKGEGPGQTNINCIHEKGVME